MARELRIRNEELGIGRRRIDSRKERREAQRGRGGGADGAFCGTPLGFGHMGDR